MANGSLVSEGDVVEGSAVPLESDDVKYVKSYWLQVMGASNQRTNDDPIWLWHPSAAPGPTRFRSQPRRQRGYTRRTEGVYKLLSFTVLCV